MLTCQPFLKIRNDKEALANAGAGGTARLKFSAPHLVQPSLATALKPEGHQEESSKNSETAKKVRQQWADFA